MKTSKCEYCESVQLDVGKRTVSMNNNKFRLSSWRNKIWTVWERDTWYEGLIRFCNRNAAIMWLKHYGKPGTLYRLENQTRLGAVVCVENGYVYFYNPDYGLMFPAESKRTQPYAIRNN